MNLNQWSTSQLREGFTQCCGSTAWVAKMIEKLPYRDAEELFATAEKVWSTLGEPDFLEAFKHHPQIGDLNSLKKKFASTQAWASQEQKSVETANSEVLVELADWNQRYLKKFGFIFIICATGKSPQQMLSALKSRFTNSVSDEIKTAAHEQSQITHLRLQKLIERSQNL